MMSFGKLLGCLDKADCSEKCDRKSGKKNSEFDAPESTHLERQRQCKQQEPIVPNGGGMAGFPTGSFKVHMNHHHGEGNAGAKIGDKERTQNDTCVKCLRTKNSTNNQNGKACDNVDQPTVLSKTYAVRQICGVQSKYRCSRMLHYPDRTKTGIICFGIFLVKIIICLALMPIIIHHMTWEPLLYVYYKPAVNHTNIIKVIR